MALAPDPQSRFRISTPVTTPEGAETFGLLTKYSFLDPKNLTQQQVIKLTITPNLVGRPDLIANQVYNSPVLDWVVVLFNKPLNPVGWPANGTVITLPVARIVLAAF